MSVVDGTFGWTVRAGRITLVEGPVACGKSTLCKVLLGEVPFARGEVRFHHAFSSISFCEQTPFLVNASLKENIVRYAPFDQKRYDEVIEATALAPDIAKLQSGHDTNVGSGGNGLSGGQKNSVSLARALYHGSQLLILDDVLSGIDNKTESEVFRRVFGPRGLIRKRGATAVLCTHSVRHLPSADHIIALGRDETVGTFDFLMENQKHIHSLGVRAPHDVWRIGRHHHPLLHASRDVHWGRGRARTWSRARGGQAAAASRCTACQLLRQHGPLWHDYLGGGPDVIQN